MLDTTVAGLELDCCIYNASGPRTGSIDALQKIGNSKSGAILSKSATLIAQDGNEMPRFINKLDLGATLCEGSVNSEGLPNYGIDYYISEDAIKSLTGFGKPYIVSLSGLSLKDNLGNTCAPNLPSHIPRKTRPLILQHTLSHIHSQKCSIVLTKCQESVLLNST